MINEFGRASVIDQNINSTPSLDCASHHGLAGCVVGNITAENYGFDTKFFTFSSHLVSASGIGVVINNYIATQ
jgi:hypothetical protein